MVKWPTGGWLSTLCGLASPDSANFAAVDGRVLVFLNSKYELHIIIEICEISENQLVIIICAGLIKSSYEPSGIQWSYLGVGSIPMDSVPLIHPFSTKVRH